MLVIWSLINPDLRGKASLLPVAGDADTIRFQKRVFLVFRSGNCLEHSANLGMPNSASPG